MRASSNRTRQSLYLDAGVAGVRLDGASLRVEAERRATRRIPLSRVTRAVIRNAGDGVLEAALAIVGAGGTVHFQDGAGRMIAVMQPSDPAATAWTRELADVIRHHGNTAPYQWWRDVQQRHAWSMVCRRGFHGDFNANCRRIARLTRHYRPDIDLEPEHRCLREHLRAWLQADLHHRGLLPVVQALTARGCDLHGTLERCLTATLLWLYVPWRKSAPHKVNERQIIQFVELQIAGRLSAQLDRHIAALAHEYYVSVRAAAQSSAHWDEEPD